MGVTKIQQINPGFMWAGARAHILRNCWNRRFFNRQKHNKWKTPLTKYTAYIYQNMTNHATALIDSPQQVHSQKHPKALEVFCRSFQDTDVSIGGGPLENRLRNLATSTGYLVSLDPSDQQYLEILGGSSHVWKKTSG